MHSVRRALVLSSLFAATTGLAAQDAAPQPIVVRGALALGEMPASAFRVGMHADSESEPARFERVDDGGAFELAVDRPGRWHLQIHAVGKAEPVATVEDVVVYDTGADDPRLASIELPELRFVSVAFRDDGEIVPYVLVCVVHGKGDERTFHGGWALLRSDDDRLHLAAESRSVDLLVVPSDRRPHVFKRISRDRVLELQGGRRVLPKPGEETLRTLNADRRLVVIFEPVKRRLDDFEPVTYFDEGLRITRTVQAESVPLNLGPKGKQTAVLSPGAYRLAVWLRQWDADGTERLEQLKVHCEELKVSRGRSTLEFDLELDPEEIEQAVQRLEASPDDATSKDG